MAFIKNAFPTLWPYQIRRRTGERLIKAAISSALRPRREADEIDPSESRSHSNIVFFCFLSAPTTQNGQKIQPNV